MRILVLALALLTLAACGADSAGGPVTTAPRVPPTEAPVSTAGPTTGSVACTRLAHRYVNRARPLFDREGAPSDHQVDVARARLMEFDAIAAQAGCGEAYTREVCSGLDDLTHQGILVIFPLITAQCL